MPASVGYAAMLLVVTLIAGGPLLFVFFTSRSGSASRHMRSPPIQWPLRWYPQTPATEQIPFWTFPRNSLIITCRCWQWWVRTVCSARRRVIRLQARRLFGDLRRVDEFAQPDHRDFNYADLTWACATPLPASSCTSARIGGEPS